MLGIRVVRVDCESGAMEVLHTVQIANAVWLVQSKDGSCIYSACNDGLVAFRVQPDGALEEFSRLPLPGLTAPCHAVVSADGSCLAWAEYRNGVIGAVELDADGAFRQDTLRTVRHEGRGFSSPRQDSPHAHCVRFTPDGKFLCAVDLSLDAVKVYDFTGGVSGLAARPELDLHFAPGTGPRHIVFHPNGHLAFVISELASRVASYRYSDGVFELVSDESLLPDGFSGTSIAAAVKVSEDGGELYCSNRGHDSLAVFSIDQATGALSRRAILPLGGSFPRDFAFAPGGRILLACLKKSGILRTYAYDRAACSLAPLADLSGLYRPLFVLFSPQPLATNPLPITSYCSQISIVHKCHQCHQYKLPFVICEQLWQLPFVNNTMLSSFT
ncbi:MAG: lactonase family protein, partial [Kiritimatiellae bacterium]|nr:lactonase family protein [Kiritimatiellia bacterium]